MAEGKQLDPIEVVVVERAFLDNHLVEPGTKRMFDPTPRAGDSPKRLTPDGKQRKLPRWAALPGDPRLAAKKPQVGDLKPKAAQAAVKAKAGALTGAGSELA